MQTTEITTALDVITGATPQEIDGLRQEARDDFMQCVSDADLDPQQFTGSAAIWWPGTVPTELEKP